MKSGFLPTTTLLLSTLSPHGFFLYLPSLHSFLCVVVCAAIIVVTAACKEHVDKKKPTLNPILRFLYIVGKSPSFPSRIDLPQSYVGLAICVGCPPPMWAKMCIPELTSLR